MSATFHVETVCQGCPAGFRSWTPAPVCPYCKTNEHLRDDFEEVDRD